ncbi:pickpocket protein 28 [Drosophila innubila]|uniref:pickpocket protein 28 n=1 Tax=Drosophila innubila TaxID=198719 RepID=UPI00148E0527|nr:pickpocket protein 28 [Drosophila innubila]
MEAKQKKQKTHLIVLKSFQKSLGTFLKETGLHGLKFVGDATLSIWERSFFLIAFVAAFILTFQLISNIYEKWNSTPVIIGISPHATSILKVPFPAITICNMNNVQRSKVAHYKEGSQESDLLKVLCSDESVNDEESDDAETISFFSSLANNSLKISDFVMNHSQTCDQMLRFCRFSGIEYECDNLFRHIVTDEGLCCVFNFHPPERLYKRHGRNLTSKLGVESVSWDPEAGYSNQLPSRYYPRPAVGSGITMGFSVVLDAQLNEYYCSSTNGPGFKLLFHNPISTPDMKDEGLVVGIGYEMNFRLEASRSEAMPSIRSISINNRQCVFMDEKKLLYHKHYSHRNCENECYAKFLYESCACIPHKYPHVYQNASICTVGDTICIRRASRRANANKSLKCSKQCLPSCFDLSYLADALYFPLAKRDFRIANALVANINKSYLLDNIAVVNLYYRESAYYGSMKNVYIGLTEFLSNIGGVMGLFMGFSVISLAEMFYFLVLKPISEFIAWKRGKLIETNQNSIKVDAGQEFSKHNNSIWHIRELYPKGIKSTTIDINGYSEKEVFNPRKGKIIKAFK